MARVGWGRSALAAAVAAGALGGAGSVEAGFVFSMAQVGPDVVLTGQGSMYVGALFGDGMPSQLATVAPRINPQAPSLLAVTGGLDVVDAFSVVLSEPEAPLTVAGPQSFGTGGLSGLGQGTGDSFGFGYSDGGIDRTFTVYVPQGYGQENPPDVLDSSTTFFNRTFASLGVTPGSYAWTLQSTTLPLTDTIVLTVDAPEPVPLPPPSLLLPGGLLALAALSRRRAPTRT